MTIVDSKLNLVEKSIKLRITTSKLDRILRRYIRKEILFQFINNIKFFSSQNKHLERISTNYFEMIGVTVYGLQ